MIYRLDPPRAWKQLIWFTLGMGVYILLVVFLPDIKKFARFRYTYIVIAILMLSSTLIVGTEIKGSQNWINFGFFSIQPSEIAKLFLILYLASTMQHIRGFKDVIISAAPVFICIALLVAAKDLGASLIFFGIFITMLYIGTSNIGYILLWTSCFLFGGFLSYFIFPHVKVRIDIWHNPWNNPKGYQIVQSLFAIAAGDFLEQVLVLDTRT
jgi:cell division protein FtsW (lipid II flippase)